MTPQMSIEFADALHTALVAVVTETPARRRGRHRRRWLLGGGISLAALTIGTATAVAVTTIPGTPIVRPVADAVSGEFTGSATIALGDPPTDASRVRLSITCLGEGTIAVTGWGSLHCGEESLGDASPNVIAIPDARTVEVTADSGMRWSFEAVYLSVTDTEWAVNDSGQSYGVPRETPGAPLVETNYPDLIPVSATNGSVGYVYKEDHAWATGDLAMQQFTSPEDALRWQETEGRFDRSIPVYESDGTTVIGHYVVAGQDSQQGRGTGEPPITRTPDPRP